MEFMSEIGLSKTQYHTCKLKKKSEGLEYLIDAATRPFKGNKVDNYYSREQRKDKRIIVIKKVLCGLAVVATLKVGISTINKPELPQTLDELRNIIAKESTNLPPNKDFTFMAPSWEDEKASDKTIYEKIFGDKTTSFDKERTQIAYDNLEQLNKDLKKYENINSKKDLDILSNDEKLKFIQTYIAREIETQKLIIHGQGYSNEEKQLASKRYGQLAGLWYKGALINVLEGVGECLDALQFSGAPVAPAGAVAKPIVAKATALGSKKVFAAAALKVDEQILRQMGTSAAKDINNIVGRQVLKEIEENIAKGIATTVSKSIDPTVIAKSKNGVELVKGNRKMGFDHIVMRHFTGEYIKEGNYSTMFPRDMTRTQIVDLIMETVETSKIVADRTGHAVIEKIFAEEIYGVKSIRVFMYEENNIYTIVSAYPLKGSKVR